MPRPTALSEDTRTATLHAYPGGSSAGVQARPSSSGAGDGGGGYAGIDDADHHEDYGVPPSIMSIEEQDDFGRRMRNWAIVVVVVQLFLLPLAAAGAYFFMSNTVMMYDPPHDTIVARTNAMSNELLQTQVFHNPVFMLVQSRDPAVPVAEAGNDDLCRFTDLVDAFRNETSLFTHVVAYCNFVRVGANAVAKEFITPDNVSTLVAADFLLGQTITQSNKVQQKLIDKIREAMKTDFHGLKVEFSSVGLVSGDLVDGLVKDLLTIDAISIPFAMAALAYCLRSVRMLVMPGAVLPVVICTAFGICYLVSLATEVSSFAPEMASATMLAITIDYCLFILSRFSELAPRFEDDYGGDSPYVRYRVCVETAKRCTHNIAVSGVTIAVALGGLILMPVKFIGSIGYVFFVSCIIAVIVSLTFMPSVLLIFYGFFRQPTDFGAFPRWVRAKCGGKRNDSKAQQPRTESGALLGNDRSAAVMRSHLSHSQSHSQSVERTRCYSDVEKDIKFFDPSNGGAIGSRAVSGDADDALGFRGALREQQYSSIWFRVGLFAHRHPWPIIFLVLAIGAPFFYFASELKVDFDLFNQVPRDSPHGRTLKYIIANIGNGQAAPFYITIDTKQNGAIGVGENRSEPVFARVRELQKHLAHRVGQPIERFNSFAMVDGVPVYPMEVPLLRLWPDFGVLWNNTVDASGRVGIVRLTTTFDPFDAQANEFLNSLDDAIADFDTHGLFEIGLMGASSTSWAIMKKVMELFPVQIGITLGIIFVLIAAIFRSVFIPFRMVLTVSYTVAMSLGAGVVMFQYDWSHTMWTAMKGVRSYSWTVPIFAFSLLCALALDYDVFLLTRLVEMHRLGFSADAAMAKAVWRTGRIISFAGIIMAISFGSMVFSDITMLNQFGFVCAFAVIIDTFVIRSLFVPALMSISPAMAWWPRRFPEPTLGLDDMEE